MTLTIYDYYVDKGTYCEYGEDNFVVSVFDNETKQGYSFSVTNYGDNDFEVVAEGFDEDINFYENIHLWGSSFNEAFEGLNLWEKWKN